MSTVKQLSKSQSERLTEIEEQWLYLREVPDDVRFIQARLEGLDEKVREIDALNARVDALPITELTLRVDSLEHKTTRPGSFERGDSSTSSVAHMEERVEELDSSHKVMLKLFNDLTDDFRTTVEAIRAEMAEMKTQGNLTMRAVGNQTPNQTLAMPNKFKIPEPKAFSGNRDAKELENFIFDMDQYFKASGTVSEEVKVTLASMHLSDDAKLWWRSKVNDVEDGRCTIDTWGDFKKELRAQFFPENVEFIARRKLRELKHTGTIREYVKQFSTVMLDIRDMSEKDKVFCFVEGLKPWARTKLYEQKVQDLASALATAERLLDYSGDQTPQKKTTAPPNTGYKATKSNPPKSFNSERKPQAPGTGPSRGPYPAGQNQPRPISCFLCKGPHRVAECPHRGALTALQASVQSCNEPETEVEAEREEDEETPRMGALKLLSAIQKKTSRQKDAVEKGLMFVDAIINSKPARGTMVDSGATHNFISEQEARRLELKVEKDAGKMKAMNSEALPIVGVSKRVPLQVAEWTGNGDLVVVRMDDFDVVLGMEFLLEHKVIPMPLAKWLIVTSNNPTVVSADI